MKLELVKEYNEKFEARYSIYVDGVFITWSSDENEMAHLMLDMVERATNCNSKREILKVMEVN